MNTKQLRRKILDLAIRGKLVPQDPNDEPASALLKRIRDEKADSITNYELRITKGKAPFDVPDGWAWCRLGDICFDFQYGTSQKSDKHGEVVVLRMGNLQNGEVDYSDLAFTSDASDIKKYLLNPNELLFNRTNSPEWVGKTAIYRGDIPAIFAGYIIRVKPIFIDPFYLNYLMNSEYHRDICFHVKTDGVNQSNINAQKLSNFTYPIPPLAEQRRIVAAIESVFTVIDEIERNKTDLQAAVAAAKRKILSLAIRGKLVPQDPNDEPASVLLKRIHAGKADSITNYELRITKGESPFDVPESWSLAMICEVCEPQETKRPAGDTFRYIDIDAIDNKRHCVSKPKVMSVRQAPSRAAKGVRNGDTLFSMVRPYLENIAFITNDLSDCIASTGFYICRPHSDILFPQYLFYYLTSSQTINGINSYMRGDNSPAIRKDEMDSFPVPIPPLAEQRRIVAAIEAAFEQLDMITEHLN